MVEKSSGLLISWLTGLYSCQKITVTIGKKHQIIHRLMRPELDTCSVSEIYGILNFLSLCLAPVFWS